MPKNDSSPDLPEGSLAVFMRDENQKSRVGNDVDTDTLRRCYLTINGTPDAYRWLASLLTQAAIDAEEHENGVRVELIPQYENQIAMTDWAGLNLECRHRGDSNSD